jgi:hypothetical protein
MDGDAMHGEPTVGAAPEPSTGLGPLVAQDLDTGQAGVVVDCGVQVVIATGRSVGASVGHPVGAAVHAMAAA